MDRGADEAEFETIAAIHARTQQSISMHQRIAERITAHVGRPLTLYVIVAGILVWIVFKFSWMEMAVTLYAALVSTLVLVTQARQARHSEQRAYLDLQMSLLSERKIAKVIGLLEELRRDLPNVRNRHDAQAETMAQEVDADAVADALETVLEQAK